MSAAAGPAEDYHQPASAALIQQCNILPWAGLFVILAVYLVCLARLHPTVFFGQMEDDSIYFSSAREIALGHGYVMPNIPGSPPVTKYPILYPWLLSWVWRLNPKFPDNLAWAAGLNAIFGMFFLATSFIFLRRIKAVGDAGALALTLFCAVNPLILALSADLMSDLAFAAFLLAACALAANACLDTSAWQVALFSGICTGLALLLRTVGVPAAFGLFLAFVLRGHWRRGAIFVTGLGPFFAVQFGRMMLIKPAAPPPAGAPCADSWHMTWLYYTSYTLYWKADVIGHRVLSQVFKNGLWGAFSQPGAYFVEPSGVRPAVLAIVVLVFLSAVAIRGMVRQAQTDGWQPIHMALGFYLLPLLVWDYANFERFLLPFLPLVAAGMWIEVRHLAAQVASEVRRKRGLEAKITAGFFMLAGCGLLLGAVLSWAKTSRLLRANSLVRAAMLEQKREAYEWLRGNTSPDVRVLAYEDASLFLYSGREAIRPTIFSPAGFYQRDVLDVELTCITSSAQPFGANFWLVSDDDFGVEWEPANSRGRAEEKKLEAIMRPLFRSTRGGVRIYGLEANFNPGHQHR